MTCRARHLVLPGTVVATIVLVACSSQRAAQPPADQIDRLFAKWNTADSPGCSLGVSRNGTTVYQRGYGMANLDLGIAITPASVFDVASISKQFTAMSILLLAGRRQLSLDDEVGRYIQNWRDHRHRITIRHLLTHSSGLRDAFLLQGLAPEISGRIDAQIVNVLTRTSGLNFVPGSRFEYNNGAYTLLGAIVERVSGQRLPEFAEANIFKPLGMNHTHFHDDTTRIVPNRATGYSRAPRGFRVAVRTYTDSVVGNAGLFTTVGDLLLWERNLTDVRVGDRALVAQMQTPAIATGWSESSEYGFGVEIAKHRGLRTIGHGGGDEGRRTYVVRYPDRGLAIALLCNLDDIDPVPLTKSTAELLLEGTFPEPASQAPAIHSVSLSPQELQSKTGLYRNLSQESVGRVFVRDGKLMSSDSANESGGFELTAIDANRFVIVGTPVVAEFVAPAAGRPQEIHVSGIGTKPMVLQLITAPFKPSREQLHAFEGTYTCDELHGTYTVVARDSRLAIRIPTRSDIDLEPVFDDAFSGSVVGVVKFFRDARGAAAAFTVNAPGARGLEFKRVAPGKECVS
jgi:CubicO group peptidase (beta-lactamase class C family)